MDDGEDEDLRRGRESHIFRNTHVGATRVVRVAHSEHRLGPCTGFKPAPIYEVGLEGSKSRRNESVAASEESGD